jgi:fructose-1-phosphate kinase PfkB-like protein
MARILVIGLNPVWQHVWRLPGLIPGKVNRAGDSWQGASGKGFNAAYVLKQLGHDVVLMQCLAGDTGRRIELACQEMGIVSAGVWVKGENRICVTLISDSEEPANQTQDDSSPSQKLMGKTKRETTELIGPFFLQKEVGETAARELLQYVQRLKKTFQPDALLISGTLPPGLSASLHPKLAQEIQASLIIGDTVQGWAEGLGELAHAVKINFGEWEELEQIRKNSGTAFSWPEWRFLTSGHQGARCEFVAYPHRSNSRLTLNLLSKNGVREGDSKKSWEWECPQIPKGQSVLNPIGAGDAASAAWMHACLRGDTPSSAAEWGMALATASCLHLEPSRFELAEVEEILRSIRKENVMATEIEKEEK